MMFFHGSVALFPVNSFVGVSIGTSLDNFAGDAPFLLPKILPEHQIHDDGCL